jgi:hypothetical protein
MTRMKLLNIQLQPARSPGLDARAAVGRLRSLAATSRISEGEDGGLYINIGFEAADPTGLWAAIRDQLRADPALAEAAIVVCQGERGWDDYLLLYHFDLTEPVDEMA